MLYNVNNQKQIKIMIPRIRKATNKMKNTIKIVLGIE